MGYCCTPLTASTEKIYVLERNDFVMTLGLDFFKSSAYPRTPGTFGAFRMILKSYDVEKLGISKHFIGYASHIFY